MPRIVIALLCLAAAPFAHADQWSKTYTITGKPDLRILTSDANIRVDTWDQNKIEARVTTEHYKIGEHGIRIEEHQSGDSVILEVRYPHPVISIDININGHKSAEVEIHMPREGLLNLKTGDGNIRVSNFKGDMTLESGDGHQNLDGVEGTLRAHAGDGHITADGKFEILELRTGDGKIEARALPGSAATSAWDLRAGDGSITLRLPDNFAADVDMRTGDGHITVDMPLAVSGRLAEKTVRGRLNGGGRPVTIHTGDGSIRLQRS